MTTTDHLHDNARATAEDLAWMEDYATALEVLASADPDYEHGYTREFLKAREEYATESARYRRILNSLRSGSGRCCGACGEDWSSHPCPVPSVAPDRETLGSAPIVQREPTAWLVQGIDGAKCVFAEPDLAAWGPGWTATPLYALEDGNDRQGGE